MKTILTVFLAGYLLWVAAYLTYERYCRRKKQRENDEVLPRKIADAAEILGKSTFFHSHSAPQEPPKTETGEPMDEGNTFATETGKYPKVVSADELDALFAEGSPLPDELEHLDDVSEPMEFRNTEAGEEPIDEDEMLDGCTPQASGLRFEDMGLAVRMAVDDTGATEEERKQAGRTLAELRGTAMFESLTAGDVERERRIATLIDLHLSGYRRQQQPGYAHEDAGVPEGFSINDIV